MWFHSRLVILPICPKQYVTFPTALSYGDIDVGRFFCSKSMETIDPRGVAKFDPRGMFGTIYNVDYQTLLHTKYISSGPYGFREENFFLFFFSGCKFKEYICCHGNHNVDTICSKT